MYVCTYVRMYVYDYREIEIKDLMEEIERAKHPPVVPESPKGVCVCVCLYVHFLCYCAYLLCMCIHPNQLLV